MPDDKGKEMLFHDRSDAGRQLARRLDRFSGRDCVTLAIPRGGIVIGREVSSAIGASLDVIAPRKLRAPYQPELAIGAVSLWGGVRIADEAAMDYLGVSPEYIEKEAEEQTLEIQRRLMAYRGSIEPPDLKSKIALIVDDGIATGYTMLAAIRSAKILDAATVVVATPVAALDAARSISTEADEMICLYTPSRFLAVGYWYREFGQVTDEEVVTLLRKAKRSRIGI